MGRVHYDEYYNCFSRSPQCSTACGRCLCRARTGTDKLHPLRMARMYPVLCSSSLAGCLMKKHKHIWGELYGPENIEEWMQREEFGGLLGWLIGGRRDTEVYSGLPRAFL